MTNIIIIGGKPCSLNMSDIIYSFDNICRINLNLKYKRSQDKDIFFVNNHLNNFMVGLTKPNIPYSN